MLVAELNEIALSTSIIWSTSTSYDLGTCSYVVIVLRFRGVEINNYLYITWGVGEGGGLGY